MTESHHNKICLALDVDTLAEVDRLVSELAAHVGVFKVGKQLFTRFGPEVVDRIHKHGGQVFLDLKFHDIPNTVKQASRACADMGVKMFNVHASGGQRMMAAAMDGVAQSKFKPIVLAVTVLTSMSEAEMQTDLHVMGSLQNHVLHLAALAKKSGVNGVVCSPQEIQLVRSLCGSGFVILTPGIRPSWASQDDQQRVTTPQEAIDQGADYIVIGRPITAAKNPADAAKKIFT